MADIGKARIRKKVYKFEMKSRYQYEKHFKVVDRPPLEKLKDGLRKLMAPKKEEKRAAEAQLAGPSKPPGGFNFAVFGGAILIALIIFALGFIYLTSQFTAPSGPLEAAAERPILDNMLIDGVIMNAGQRGDIDHVAGVFIDYNTTSLDNYTLILTPYKGRMPSEVYVLNSEKVEATIYADFIRELRWNLASRNIILNEITIKQLETIPQGAIVIVPSGVVPQELLGVDSRITMGGLADRGVVVIYIGQPFTRMLDGTLAVSTPQAVLKELPVVFDETASLTPKGDFSVFQPLYVATGRSWSTELAYGTVSVIKSGDGAFIFVPQTLDGGWRKDAGAAAGNISRIIYDIPWAKALAPSNSYVLTNQSDYAGTKYFYTQTFKATEASIKVDFIGESETTKNPVRESLYIYLEKPTVSELFIEGDVKVVSTNLTNRPIRMNADMKEPEPGQPNMFLVALDENGTQVQVFPQGPVNIQADRSFDLLVYLDKGEYQIKLVDDESKLYAISYMKVVTIDVTYAGVLRNRPAVYVFEITRDGQPITLDNVEVVVDGGTYGSYNFSRVSTINLDLERHTGSSQQRLPDGTHTFKFISAGLSSTVDVTHATASSIFTQPLFWITALLTLGIVGMGLYFARQEEIYFSIDIPDFPPVARTRIPLSPDVVLSLFQKVNENYRWEYTPLTATEVKNAFKSVFIKGKPIYITDYNVEYLLDDLKKRGSVKESLEYYGLTAWEEKSGRTTDYLSLMRKLRDICVNNAVPFTGLNESKKADSVITVVGQQMFLHFYDKGSDARDLLKSILRTISEGITIVVFKNHAEKEHFESLVNSSATIAPLILKMESNSKSLLLYTSEELESMIKEFKGM